ncbi:hypothetical protein NFI95_15640 [Acetobacteraceae bacterium KSS8]|uniref:Uncharacterized protein n=1 Tax=Endosaccharibacter trunci TaxID=2812733 RepID=A0ABT1WAH7_9PROT|nr:hypothetical protein [Acetobacteraceae bacterium KSS8]
MSAMLANKKRRKGKKRPNERRVPSIIVETGMEHRFRLGAVEVEHVADPSAPNRTIARPLASAVGRLRARRSITVHQATAADRYGELRELESGAIASGGGDANGARMPFWQKGHPTMTQVQAAASLRRIHEIIGRRQRLMLDMLVIQNMDISAIAAAHSRIDPVSRARVPMNEKFVKGGIDLILDRLVEHFGLDGSVY